MSVLHTVFVLWWIFLTLLNCFTGKINEIFRRAVVNEHEHYYAMQMDVRSEHSINIIKMFSSIYCRIDSADLLQVSSD